MHANSDLGKIIRGVRRESRVATSEIFLLSKKISVLELDDDEEDYDMVCAHVCARVMFFSESLWLCNKSGGQKMAKKSKKEKAAGREKHRQLLRAKKLQKKQKKTIALPQKHRKNKR